MSGCKLPGRVPGAGSVRSTHSASSRRASASFSNRAFLASNALSSDCLAAFSSLPTLARSSGESLPISLLICASVPFRPSTSTRTASSASGFTADSIR